MLPTSSSILCAELSQCYKKVCRYCFEGCRKNCGDKKKNVIFWNKLQFVSEKIYKQIQMFHLKQIEEEYFFKKEANILYSQGISFSAVNSAFKNEKNKINLLKEKETLVNNAYRQGYTPLNTEKYGINFTTVGDNKEFLPWKEHENPYSGLQMNNFRNEKTELSLEETQSFFFDLVSVLEKKEETVVVVRSKICDVMRKYGIEFNL